MHLEPLQQINLNIYNFDIEHNIFPLWLVFLFKKESVKALLFLLQIFDI